MDIIAHLGEMAFASRLRRLSDRLGRDVTALYHKLDVDFEARWFTLFYALNRHSPQTVTGLARSLGISHTAVKQLAKEMARKGLVTWSQGRSDRRQQLISLTAKGRTVAHRLQPVWQVIRSATKELLDRPRCRMLAELETIEQQLDERNMFDRVWLRLTGSLPGEADIVEYGPAMKKYFQSLNREWLTENFTIEKADERMLADPNRTVIRRGGAILFAVLDGETVGTCSLIRHPGGIYELAKMAVTKKYQRRGIGTQLLEAVRTRATAAGASELYLRTNAKLEAANRLYRKIGFVTTPAPASVASGYHRPTFWMKLQLTAPGSP